MEREHGIRENGAERINFANRGGTINVRNLRVGGGVIEDLARVAGNIFHSGGTRLYDLYAAIEPPATFTFRNARITADADENTPL